MFGITVTRLQTGLHLDIIRHEFVSCSCKRHLSGHVTGKGCDVARSPFLFFPGNTTAVSSFAYQTYSRSLVQISKQSRFFKWLSDLRLCKPLHCAFLPYEKFILSLERSVLNFPSHSTFWFHSFMHANFHSLTIAKQRKIIIQQLKVSRSKKSTPVNLVCCMAESDPCFLNHKPSVLEPSGFALIPDGQIALLKGSMC